MWADPAVAEQVRFTGWKLAAGTFPEGFQRNMCVSESDCAPTGAAAIAAHSKTM
jgi:hypothetical protein